MRRRRQPGLSCVRMRPALALVTLAFLAAPAAQAAEPGPGMGRLDYVQRFVHALDGSATRPLAPQPSPGAGTDVPGPPSGTWSDQFGIAGIDGSPVAATYFEGDLVVSGNIFAADGKEVTGVVRWDGHQWRAIGRLSGTVNALVVWRGQLVAGGHFLSGATFTGKLAMWNGTTWDPFPGDDFDGTVLALATDGSALVIGGSFSHIGTVVTGNVAHWDGTFWDPMTGGTDGPVLAVVPLAAGWAVGGQFANAGGLRTNDLALWNGSGWDPLGTVTDHRTTDHVVFSMARYGDDLLVGGSFDAVDGVGATGVALRDGAGWHALLGAPKDLLVTALAVDASVVHIGGVRTSVPFEEQQCLATWDGASYAEDPTGPDNFPAAIAVDAGRLAVCGRFDTIGGRLMSRVAEKQDGNWSPTEGWRVPMHGLSSLVEDLTRYGADVVAVGAFQFAADDTGWVRAGGIARWDGAHWQALGDHAPLGASELLADHDLLYAAGTQAWKWDGARWSELGDVTPSSIEHLAVYHGQIWGGGRCFGLCPGASGLWRFDRGGWVPVQPPADVPTDNSLVTALSVYNDRLVVSWVTYVSKELAHTRLVPWDGSAWGPDLGDFGSGIVTRLATFHGHLCAIGSFAQIDGQDRSEFAILEDQGWDSHGFDGPIPLSIATTDSTLFVGGSSIVKWDGARWSTRGNLMGNGNVTGSAISLLADRGSLWAGGDFNVVDGTRSYSIARFDYPPPSPPVSSNVALAVGPNPSHDLFALRFTLPEAGPVRITIHDLMGREVRLLLDRTMPAGSHTVQWDTLDKNGRGVRMGLYFARLESGPHGASTRTIALVR